MAVSFKVPKSPKRDIAATDAFLGVDLTNTGANIEGYRSPHAPNMVRLVPGKVRKRMGYYKEVLFGTKTNVNFAKDTSAKEQEIVITSDDTATWVKVYDLIKTLSFDSSSSLYLDFDYKSEDTFNIVNSSVEVTASEDWEHISTTVYFTEDTDVADIKIFSDNVQDIYIKNFSAMVERDDNYEWSPAPEYYVERENNDPINGVHYIRRMGDSYEGDRVTNVNRALNTSSEYVEVSLVSGTKTKACDLADELETGTEVTIDFDCEPLSSGQQVYVYFFGRQYPDTIIRDYEVQTGHFTYTTEVKDLDIINPKIEFEANSGSFTFSIKNFTATYNKDKNYKWSPAPEDNGGTFHVEDLTDVGTKNYATKTSGSADGYSGGASYAVASFGFYNSQDDERPDGLIHVSFDVTTSNTGTASINKLKLFFGKFNNYTGAYYTTTRNITNALHIEAFVSDCSYVSARWELNSESGTPKYTINVSNVVINQYSVRKNFVYSSRTYLYHVGKDFYLRDANTSNFDKVYEDANDHISRSFQLNNKCYIIDGKDIYQYSIDGGESIEVIGQDNAYIPTVTKGKEPSGGGTPYDALNLLQPGFEETFYGNGSDKTFQLSFSGLDATEVEAWLLNSSGDWVIKGENSDFTVNRTTGKVTFTTAPGNSPIEGEPNVRVQAYRTVPDYRERITKCTIGVLYGIGGATNRLFLTGNQDHPNWDFYSQMDDPTYFPDIAYSVMGSEQSMIKGYAVVSNYLATFKDGFDQSQSVFVREGDMLVTDEETKTSEPVFKLVNTLQGEGVVAPYSFGYLQTEPVFLTKAGIYAITEQDITGEKYSQNRSFYLDGKLRKETGLENAIATVYDNQYILALNGKLYVLDGLQATRTDKSEPYATRQYAGFLCEDIPATCLWTDDAVCFGTSDGKVCKFYTDVDSLSSYNDDGKAIYSCWETPDLDGQLFYKNKTFRYMAVRLMAALKTSVKLYSRRFGIWTLNDETAWTFIKGQTSIGNSLDFNDLDFNLFSFSADTTERVVHTKLRVKKVDKARFRVENKELDEPFGIFDLALEYIESGNYKG